jgi:hypothetical protein
MRAGARNLLLGCAGVEAGQHVLLVREDRRHGYYGDVVVTSFPAFDAGAPTLPTLTKFVAIRDL